MPAFTARRTLTSHNSCGNRYKHRQATAFSNACDVVLLVPANAAPRTSMSVDADAVRARVEFEMALKRAQGNHIGFDTTSTRAAADRRYGPLLQGPFDFPSAARATVRRD